MASTLTLKADPNFRLYARSTFNNSVMLQIDHAAMEETEPHVVMHEFTLTGDGQELDPKTMACRTCRKYMHILSQQDTSPNLKVILKEGKYFVYQKHHLAEGREVARQQHQQGTIADQDSHGTESNEVQHSDTGKQLVRHQNTNTQSDPERCDNFLKLPIEIRFKIYSILFTSFTEGVMSRRNCYPLPHVVRVCSAIRDEGVKEWGNHLNTVLQKHTDALDLNRSEQAEASMMRMKEGVRINVTALEAYFCAARGKTEAIKKRIDKLRLLLTHQMLADNKMRLRDGGSGERWRDGNV